MINTSGVRIFKARDSATSLLRKLGVNSRDYNLFIDKMDDGGIVCKVALAMEHVESLKVLAEKPTKPAKPIITKPHQQEVVDKLLGRDTKPKAPAKKSAKPSISGMAREMILAGKTNEEIWEALKSTFDLDHSKRHYPVWYRCEMKRKGKLAADA